MTQHYEKVERIQRYATNNESDYFRLQIINNWNKDYPIYDELLEEYLAKMRKWCSEYRFVHPMTIAVALCQEGLKITGEKLEYIMYGEDE